MLFCLGGRLASPARHRRGPKPPSKQQGRNKRTGDEEPRRVSLQLAGHRGRLMPWHISTTNETTPYPVMQYPKIHVHHLRQRARHPQNSSTARVSAAANHFLTATRINLNFFLPRQTNCDMCLALQTSQLDWRTWHIPGYCWSRRLASATASAFNDQGGSYLTVVATPKHP